MSDEVTVHVNREKVYGVEVPVSFEATGPFTLRVVNHGEPLHVTLTLDGLDGVAAIEANNHSIDAETERAVRVTVDPDRLDGDRQRGTLAVAAGHGATRRQIDLVVKSPDAADTQVQVGEDLGEPRVHDDGPTLGTYANLVALAVGAFALALAAVASFLVDATVVLAGSLVLLASVLVALVLVLRARYL